MAMENMGCRRKRREAGFTLPEVMIATVLLAVGLMTIAVAQLSALRTTSRSKYLSQAMYLAEEQMALFQAMPATQPLFQVAGTTLDPTNPIQLETTGDGMDDDTTFVRRWIMQPNTPQPGLTTILVQVDWGGAQVGPAVQTVTLQGFKGLF